ncbi:MAG TPA: nicotinate-nicotinamide nucleotide adenylyltransferase [Desulfobacteraceae bacterium]|nr:nicotinate-nicotinamide nucleotide adenylyltransferase [Desulfobacteraceae bacterium]
MGEKLLIGLFGGTFNPIHIGHLRAAQEVLESFESDKIIFIPSALPPHKQAHDLTDAGDRLEMIRLSIQTCPKFEVSDIELKRPGRSYTIDTVRYFKSVLPDAKLYFMIGMDAFLEIDAWKSYQDLLSLISFIVMARPGTGDKIDRVMLENYLQTRISEDYRFSESEMAYIHPEKQPVFGINVRPLDISSSAVRKLIRQNKSVRFLVPEAVENFIKNKGLFTEKTDE